MSIRFNTIWKKFNFRPTFYLDQQRYPEFCDSKEISDIVSNIRLNSDVKSFIWWNNKLHWIVGLSFHLCSIKNGSFDLWFISHCTDDVLFFFRSYGWKMIQFFIGIKQMCYMCDMLVLTPYEVVEKIERLMTQIWWYFCSKRLIFIDLYWRIHKCHSIQSRLNSLWGHIL